MCYEKGEGVDCDLKQAKAYFSEANNVGFKLAVEGLTRVEAAIKKAEAPVVSTNSAGQPFSLQAQVSVQPVSGTGALENFLKKLGLSEYLPVLSQEKVDYEELAYVTDRDLEKLNIPLGHRRKILRERGVINIFGECQFVFINGQTGAIPSSFGNLLQNAQQKNQIAQPIQEAKQAPAIHQEVLASHNTVASSGPDTQYEYDMFLSHKQANGADLAQSIKLQLQALRPDLRVFLDVDDLNEVHKLEDLVARSKHFVLLITEGVLERPFVQVECRTALKLNKNLVLVHDERNCQFPSGAGLSDDLKPLLSPLAVPYYRPKAFRDVSIKAILEKLK